MFYLTTHSTHFIYGYMVSDIWLRTILIEKKEIWCRHIGYSFRLAARVLLYASSHRLCWTSCGALVGTRNSSMGPPRRIDPTIHCTMIKPRSYVSLPLCERIRGTELFQMARLQLNGFFTVILTPVSHSSQCSMTGVPKAMVCAILACGLVHIK